MDRAAFAFARHIVSWYAGVPADQAARAERVHVLVVRSARTRMGRSAELGLVADELVARHGGRDDEHGRQMTFAELDRQMRENRGHC